MIEKLIELCAGAWETIKPYVVVNAYEQVVILRWGKYHRTLEPGLHWKIPFADSTYEVHTAVTTLRLPPQTLTTKDDVGVVVAAIIKYQVRDPEPYVTDVFDQVDVLGDVTMGAIRNAVVGVEWTDLKVSPPEASVLAEVRKQANRFGFKIEAVTFVDLGRVRSLRLIGDNVPLNLDN